MSKTKADIYRDALINIMFYNGKCWDGDRECHDPQHVANDALRKADPNLYRRFDSVKYPQVKVYKNGTVRVLAGKK